MPNPRRTPPWPTLAILSFLAPVLAAVLLYQLDSFDPAPIPIPELTHPLLTAPLKNDHMLKGSEFVGVGKLLGPEDIAYDGEMGVMYASCGDGWIRRVRINDSVSDSVVEDWVNTGGRPLGLSLGHEGEVIVADAYKGLLKISRSGEMELLTNEAGGIKFKLTDEVDIARDGTLYFTDATCKFDMEEAQFDFLEGRPHGRFMSFDPLTKETQTLARDLYFPNGVAVSPDQDYVVFCETAVKLTGNVLNYTCEGVNKPKCCRRSCKKYYIDGEKKGRIEKFIDRLPGMPDNIHYDGHGHYLIGINSEVTSAWRMAQKYPVIRKIMAITIKYMGRNAGGKNGGVFIVDLEGKPIAHYYDPDLKLITSGYKVGNHLYCGSLTYPYIVRLDLAKHPATAK